MADDEFVYYIQNGAVWKAKRKPLGQAWDKPERVADGLSKNNNDVYILSGFDGDVATAEREWFGEIPNGGSEKVAKLGLTRDEECAYLVKNGAVWKSPRKQPGQAKGKPHQITATLIDQDPGYVYFLDEDGDVSRARREGP